VNRVIFGMVAGLVFGVVDVLLMIPLDLPDKKTAMLGAFLNRFAIGFLIPMIDVGVPGWVRGMAVALLISLPDAVITKAYAPIIIVGLVGGAIIGWAAGRWAV
jgi:hypothetical protein